MECLNIFGLLIKNSERQHTIDVCAKLDSNSGWMNIICGGKWQYCIMTHVSHITYDYLFKLLDTKYIKISRVFNTLNIGKRYDTSTCSRQEIIL